MVCYLEFPEYKTKSQLLGQKCIVDENTPLYRQKNGLYEVIVRVEPDLHKVLVLMTVQDLSWLANTKKTRKFSFAPSGKNSNWAELIEVPETDS